MTEKLHAALTRIARNEIEVFDEDTQGNVLVSMDAEEMASIAYAALAEHTREQLEASQRPTPAADEVEEVARAIEKYERDALAIKRFSWRNWQGHARAAIAAMQARSAEPAGEEPVAWMYDRPEDGLRYTDDHLFWPVRNHFAVERGWKETPLYATPANPERLVEALRKGAFLMTEPRPTPSFPRARQVVIGFESPDHAHDAHEAIARAIRSAAPLKEGQGE